MEIIAIVGSRTKTPGQADHVRRLVGSRMRGLLKQYPNPVFISGGASSGADYWCKTFCKQWKLQYIEAPAFWTGQNGLLDKSAGPFRNTTIAQVCTRAVVFWNGFSTGTDDFRVKAERMGRPVELVSIVYGELPFERAKVPGTSGKCEPSEAG